LRGASKKFLMQIVNEKNPNAATLAHKFLRAGKIIAIPTDTVYGLACDASNLRAVEALYKIKNRDEKKPIAIFLRDIAHAKKIFIFDETAEKIAARFLPGALTLVLKKRNEANSPLASNLNKADDEFLGFRLVDSFFVKKIFEKFDGILAVTSANMSGETAANTAQEIKRNLSDLDLLIEGELSSQPASTVVKIDNNKITILRQGSVVL